MQPFKIRMLPLYKLLENADHGRPMFLDEIAFSLNPVTISRNNEIVGRGSFFLEDNVLWAIIERCDGLEQLLSANFDVSIVPTGFIKERSSKVINGVETNVITKCSAQGLSLHVGRYNSVYGTINDQLMTYAVDKVILGEDDSND